MEDTPDDILCLIFETYVHDLQLSPTNLLTVNRRWHALLVGTSTLWTRISIVVDSFDTIPSIIGNSKCQPVNMATLPLLIYLGRSGELPLDVLIRWEPVDTSSDEIEASIVSYMNSFSPLLGCMRLEHYRLRKDENDYLDGGNDDDTDGYNQNDGLHACEIQTDELLL
jgi:hypothetical protein